MPKPTRIPLRGGALVRDEDGTRLVIDAEHVDRDPCSEQATALRRLGAKGCEVRGTVSGAVEVVLSARGAAAVTWTRDVEGADDGA